ncbi:MAG: exopolysaccharide biosynthesis polyprenyl glycosylphosphotransferase [Rubrobacteraceae bacterium]|nr:exopolysaccharide biosynthesis polyprenyl glycosylphosphotransferase [Rubrobacteraceae bacterium]
MREAIGNLLSSGVLRRPASVLILLLIDAGSLGAALSLASGSLHLVPVLLAVLVPVFVSCGMYGRASSRRNPGTLVGALLLWAALVVAGAHFYPESGLPGEEAVAAVVLFGLLSIPLRLLYERGLDTVYRRGIGLIPTLIVGDEAGRERLRRLLDLAPGAYTPAGEAGLTPQGRVDIDELRRTLEESGAKLVLLAGAERLPDDNLLEVLQSVRLRGVQMWVVPGALGLMRLRPSVSRSLGVPLLDVRYPRLDNFQRTLKRALDLALSATGLLALLPLFALVALAIKLDSPGPVLFRQRRVGADERVFTCYMFRSMYEGAEEQQEELEEANEADGILFKIRDDPRVTRVGRFLRRWSIDELPQLINVLKGEMSLVGPRPLPLRDHGRMKEAHKKRLAVMPGMTGYWQINGRDSLSFEEMVRLDLYYIENWSLSFDIKIIILTIGAVLRRKGAY